MMKTIAPLLIFLISGFSSCFGQYEPATPDSTIAKDYTEVEIRRFLLTQEKGTPVWELAKQSQVSHSMGVLATFVGTAFILSNAVILSSGSSDGYYGTDNSFYYTGVAFGVANIGVAVWQLLRADLKLQEAKRLYKYQ
ncbi:hypothetical protein [Owenweeksia hongkongensis]|uniref:Lipoprotein n=1 Tax=Owenweeksia hongkongensis (strain DSM 17368 / CIP 108786 / JCM 12287 / NRRL B-23963 / UST20020801) TaxID=926562 RepID=G8R5T8_OWEHD|nr:hypothetical protein [Owenweeksia hongkongensis]AEV31086.1 hypothetical protein Oweho_0062 [Owenweeksia hongkongensis DSM 17368]